MPDNVRFGRAHALWDELASFDAAHTEEALTRLMQGLSDLVEARNVAWIGAVRTGEVLPDDPVQGWWLRAIRYLHPGRRLAAAASEQVRNLEAGQADISTIRNVSFAGQFRVHLLKELVPPSWFKGDYYRLYYTALNRHDAIWAGVPINENAEVYFGLYRGAKQPRFTEADRDMVAYALRSLRGLLHQHMLSRGLLVASSPLTKLERQVVQALLTGLPEREIAETLDHGYNTTHEYVIRIFRKYGVSNRAALMALWLAGSAKFTIR
jgi:DNA-binding CsgD family transcriptional regulator